MVHLGPFMVTWHRLLIAAGVVVSAYAARHYARRFGFDADITHCRMLPDARRGDEVAGDIHVTP